MKLAIIPARGGSKRIPKKNIKAFAGKPLIAYSIEAAIQSNVFDVVMVSTDCEDIANVAKLHGADVPFIRPESLSDDFTGTRAVTNHAIRFYEQQGVVVDYACCIYATAPFIQPQYIKQGLALLEHDMTKSFAFTATSFPFPIQRAMYLINDSDRDGVQFFQPEHINTRSQDLTEAYHDAGQFYWGRAKDYVSKKGMFSAHSLPIILPRHLVQDIDTQEDWLRAELMYKSYISAQDS